MLIIRIKGGLGNQLFQYASAYSLSKRLEQQLRMDISFYPRQTLRGYKLGQLLIEESDMFDAAPKGIVPL